AVPEIYTLSLHDALPILGGRIVLESEPSVGSKFTLIIPYVAPSALSLEESPQPQEEQTPVREVEKPKAHITPEPAEEKPLSSAEDRKSTRLNSSHVKISY